MENSLAAKFPEIAKEWHPTKNGTLTPDHVKAKSNKKYWFKCSKGHVWLANVSNRTSSFRGSDSKKGSSCPYCTNKKVCLDNCLETTHPEIAKEWHPTLNGCITPRNVVGQSHKKYWFKCGKGHVWLSSIAHRMRGRSCPYCSNKRVCLDNCLETTHPEIAKEWHPTLNGCITPRDIIPGTGKAYWFKCERGHDFKVKLYCRTGFYKTGCPHCLYKTQEKVRDIFQDIFKVSFPKLRAKFLQRLEYDGANESLKLAFEYDGEFHDKPHYASKNPQQDLKKTKERDAKKDRLTKENGWFLIRIHHSQKNRIRQAVLENIAQLPKHLRNKIGCCYA